MNVHTQTGWRSLKCANELYSSGWRTTPEHDTNGIHRFEKSGMQIAITPDCIVLYEGKPLDPQPGNVFDMWLACVELKCTPKP